MRKVLFTTLPQPYNMADVDSLLPNGKGVWIPIDHGVSDYPVEGLEDLDKLIESISHADAIVAQKGVVSRYSDTNAKMISHLSVSTRHAGPRSSDKVLVGSVEESLSRGAEGVSVQVNMGSPDEPDMIERLGIITQDAHFLDCPVLGMIYPRGENLEVMDGDNTQGAAHAARLAFELGCDVVKTKWTGSIESFRKVTNAVPIPVLIAGGPAGSTTEETLTIVHQAMQAGGGGVCMGRQVFMHSSPGKMVTALRSIIHDGSDVKQAMQDAGL